MPQGTSSRSDTGALDSTGKHLVHVFHQTFRNADRSMLMYLGSEGSERGNLVLASTRASEIWWE